ncbi:MAG: hypothetical protein ACYDDF_14110 [Thermoplasmatota archaeon]
MAVADELVRSANNALANGKLLLARQLATSALRYDPNHAEARRIIDIVDTGGPREPVPILPDWDFNARGLKQSAKQVVGLTMITLGFYLAFYFWRIAREVDALTKGRAMALRTYQIGLIWEVGVLAFGFVWFRFVAAQGYPPPAFVQVLSPMSSTWFFLAIGAVPLGYGLLAGWRVWTATQAAQRELKLESTTDPWQLLMAALGACALSGLVSVAGRVGFYDGGPSFGVLFVFAFVFWVILGASVLVGTQHGLNEVWKRIAQEQAVTKFEVVKAPKRQSADDDFSL